MLNRESSFTFSVSSFRSAESAENIKETDSKVVESESKSSGRPSASEDSFLGHGGVSSAKPKTLFEISPRFFLYCPGEESGGHALLKGVSVDVRSWLGEASDNGHRVALFRTGCSSSIETDNSSSRFRSVAFKNQILVFPQNGSRHSLGQILEVVGAFSFWYQLERRENLVLFEMPSTLLNVALCVAACLLATDFSLSVDVACSKLQECFSSSLLWSKADKRYLGYIHTLLRENSTGITHRPRPILVKQLLIDSCFCRERELEIQISDGNGVSFLNQHVVQFFHEETQSIAVQFPQMRNFLFQGDVCVVVKSRDKLFELEFRFNTGFMDNLTSSVQTCGLALWDDLVNGKEKPAPENLFSVQIITVPATNATSTPIVVSPYSSGPSASVFADKHIVGVNQDQLNQLMSLSRSSKELFDLTSVSVALKVTNNNYLDAVTFLYKFFAPNEQPGGKFHPALPSRLNNPACGDQDDAVSVASSGSSISHSSARRVMPVARRKVLPLSLRQQEVAKQSPTPSSSCCSVSSFKSFAAANTPPDLMSPVLSPIVESPIGKRGTILVGSDVARLTGMISPSERVGETAELTGMRSPPERERETAELTGMRSPPERERVTGGTTGDELVGSPPKKTCSFGVQADSKPDELLTPSPVQPSSLGKSTSLAPPVPPAPRLSLGKTTSAPPPPHPPPKSSGSPPPVPLKAPGSLPLRKAPPVPSASVPPLFELSQGEEQLPLGRKLHWRPLRNVESTIWATMDVEAQTTDFSVLKSVFDDSSSSSLSKKSLPLRSSSSSSSVDGNGGVAWLLESKRAQNIGVVVARIPIQLVTERLMSLDLDALSVEVLDRLKMILPTEEESKMFSQFKGEVSSLRDIEQKIFHLFRIPRLIQRIKFSCMAIQLPQVLSELQDEIDVLRSCAIEVRRSEKLRKLLHLVLLLGNYVNHGDNNSNNMKKKTRGFSIESLSKLSEFKSSSDPGLTTMHVLCAKLMATSFSTSPSSQAQKNFLSQADLYSEIPSLKIAVKISPESISQSIFQIKNDPELIKNELKVHREKYHPASVGRMEKFVTETEPRVKHLLSDWSSCEVELSEIRKFFGEDPKKISIEEFFSHISKFADGILATVNDMQKRPKRFEPILLAERSLLSS